MNIVKNFNLCCLFLKSIIAINKINKYNNEQQQQKNTHTRQIGGQIMEKEKKKYKNITR